MSGTGSTFQNDGAALHGMKAVMILRSPRGIRAGAELVNQEVAVGAGITALCHAGLFA